MGLKEYIKMLGLNGDNLFEMVDEMSEERAKELLKIIITLLNED